MLSNLFGDSPFDAYNLAYPDKFKPWEFGQAPIRFWSKETGIKATKWLIEEKLKWNDDEILSNLTYETFSKNGLRGMLQHVYNHSPFEAINLVYPNKFKPWEFRKTPLNFWNKDTAVTATRWMVEEKLKLPTENLNNIKRSHFEKYGLEGC